MTAIPRLPPRLLAVFAILAFFAAWLGGDLLARRVSIAAELRYLPPDYALLVATGSPQRLWAAVDDHFGTLIRSDPYKGLIYQQFRSLHQQLKRTGLTINSLGDVEAAGFDLTRGVVAGLYPSNHVLVVINASDVGRLARTISIAIGGSDSEVPTLSTTPVRMADNFVANPTGRIVVISDDEGLINTALARQSDNRRQAFGSDLLYEAIAERMPSPMLTGASLFFSTAMPFPWRMPLIRHLSAVIDFDRDITVDASVDLEMAPVRVLDALVAPPPPLQPWAEELPRDTATAATVTDRAIPLYVDALSRAGLLTALEQRYAGVLGELRTLPSLRQVTLAATGYHDGLPDLLFGVWADPPAVDAMVTRIQSRIRIRRDQAVLYAAQAAGRAPAPEPGAIFERYRRAGNVFEPPQLTAQDFANAEYERRVDGGTIRFLLPPVTANDLTYRTELEQVVDPARLTGDRYRLAVALVGDAHWFATDAALLEAKLRREPTQPSLRTLNLFENARRAWSGTERMQAFANLDRIIEAGLLSPEDRVSNAIRQSVFDLREHPSVSVSLVTSPRPARARFLIRISRE